MMLIEWHELLLQEPNLTVPNNPISDLANECVQCAACLPSCPTYSATHNENFSPRGRIALIKAYAEGKLADDKAWTEAVDTCLNCGACEQACPPKVKYDQLFRLARNRRVEQKTRRTPFKEMLFNLLLKHPWLKSLFIINPLLPNQIRTILPLPYRLAPHYEVANAKEPIHILVDCALGTFGPEHFNMAAFVLNKLGYSVTLHRVQGCCGGWWDHIGRTNQAHKSLQALKRNLSTLQGPLTLYTMTSGCHQFLLKQLNIPTKSVYDLISTIWINAENLPSLSRYAGHYAIQSPCTAGPEDYPQAYSQILAKIPGLTVLPLPKGCCGAGGAMALAYPQMANKVTNQRFSNTTYDGIITFNMACRQQIQKVFPQSAVTEAIYPLAKALGYGK